MADHETSPESGNQYPDEMVEALRQLKERGVDFEEEDIEHISQMDEDEKLEYLMQALLEAGDEDALDTIMSLGLIESFRIYTPEEIAARNRNSETQSLRVDELDESDRQTGAGSYPRETGDT